MRLSKLIVPILAIGKFTAGTATTCSSGISGIEAGGVCCVKECGQCGGPGCGTRKGTDGVVRDCCTSSITNNNKLCSMEKKAPCIVDKPASPGPSPPSMPPGSNPMCTNGIPGIEAGGVCCVKECGQCGGPGCGTRMGTDGVVRDCCTSTIKDSDQKCSKEKKAPCIVDSPSPKPSPPSMPPGTATTCSNGIPGVEAGGVCCVKECGLCGGPGCGRRMGTDGAVRNCCTSIIKDDDKLCSKEKKAPCIVDNPGPKPTPPGPSPPSMPPAGLKSLGCFNDQKESPRLFEHEAKVDSKMTPQLCAKECKGKALFGLQYGTECWCSESKSGYDKYGKGNKCNMPCGGDSEQMCGGRFAMEVYEVPSSPAPAPGPMPKPPSPMPKPPSGGSFVCDGLLDSKGEVCCKAECGECGGKGCGKRAGLTGDDCCIGNIMETAPKCSVYGKAPCNVDEKPMSPSPTPPKPPAPTPSTGGPFTCEGNQGILKKDICCSPGCGECGGKNCAKRGPGLTGDDCCTSAIVGSKRVCSKTGQAPCIFDGVAPAPTPPGPPPPSPPHSGLKPLGCFNDQKENPRLFEYKAKVDSKMTPQLCAKECKGKALFGLQYGTECWCSGSKSGYDKYGKGNKCDMPCGGDSEQMCGGRFAMEVYEVPSSPAPAPGPMPKPPSPMPKPPSPMPKPPSGGPFVCDGLLDSKGEVCCKAACGECGGTGCGTRAGLTGNDCCIGNIMKAGPKCSVQGKAPCVVDAAVAPGPTPVNALPGPPPGMPSPIPASSCGSRKANIEFKENLIKLSGGGCATLTDIYEAQYGNGHLEVLLSAESKTGSVSADITGYWLLKSDLKVYGGSTLYVQGTSKDGDCDVLRIQSTGSKAWEIMGHGGNLKFESTKVTSWDTSKGAEQTNYKKKRAFLRCITEYDDSDKYKCKGHSTKDMGTCRMDLIDSVLGNMGWDDKESYGLTWKVRGLCTPGLENVSLFETRNVYGDIKDCDIYGMYYGMYSYGHQGGEWVRNKMHDNIQYGFDPHDDSDNLTIAHNEVWGNKNHGIIASKRCNNVKIYNNTVYDNDECGIMLHRSSDKAEVYDNTLWGNKNAGVAFFESMDGHIHDNNIKGCDDCQFGIRLSLGSENNLIEDNVLDNFSRYGLYTYKGSDKPEASDGRPKNNKFVNNDVFNVEVGVQIKDSRDIVFQDNEFVNVKTYEFPDSKGTVWKNNKIGGGCTKDNVNFASGSIPKCQK